MSLWSEDESLLGTGILVWVFEILALGETNMNFQTDKGITLTSLWKGNRTSTCSQWDESVHRIGCGVMAAQSNQEDSWQMTAANWKTNEVQIPSLGPDVCVREVMRSRKKDRAIGQPCQEQMLIKQTKTLPKNNFNFSKPCRFAH